MPPVRDEESETQRKAHAKRVRETRRSTQGVTLEEIKVAEQLVKKKNQQQLHQATQQLSNNEQVHFSYSCLFCVSVVYVLFIETVHSIIHFKSRNVTWRSELEYVIKIMYVISLQLHSSELQLRSNILS